MITLTRQDHAGYHVEHGAVQGTKEEKEQLEAIVVTQVRDDGSLVQPVAAKVERNTEV